MHGKLISEDLEEAIGVFLAGVEIRRHAALGGGRRRGRQRRRAVHGVLRRERVAHWLPGDADSLALGWEFLRTSKVGLDLRCVQQCLALSWGLPYARDRDAPRREESYQTLDLLLQLSRRPEEKSADQSVFPLGSSMDIRSDVGRPFFSGLLRWCRALLLQTVTPYSTLVYMA
jgi:hypothetical protein